jgi:hypothetical protein
MEHSENRTLGYTTLLERYSPVITSQPRSAASEKRQQ